MDDPLEVQLSRLIIQDKADQQFIHLRERFGDRSFPIVIGFNEAWEIQSKLLKQRTRRPMTHDLIGSILRALECQIRRVVITELRDNTFFAVLVLHLPHEDQERDVDCRPSDAIALAVQMGVPIFVARKVLDEAAS
ncbi:MAG: bifunctional nuclease family protein [Planctomycetota bacterium]